MYSGTISLCEIKCGACIGTANRRKSCTVSNELSSARLVALLLTWEMVNEREFQLVELHRHRLEARARDAGALKKIKEILASRPGGTGEFSA